MTVEAAEMTDAEFAQACHDSPTFFAREMLGVEPTQQQQQLFDAISPPGAHVAVRSGHGVGKSTSLAALALWYLVTREDAKVPCTAPSGHQLEDVLWSEIRRLVAGMSEYMQDQIQIKADKVTMRGSAGYIVARTARPENPDALQGFHAENLLFIIDEAAGVSEKVFEVARGALSTPSARVVMTGNPTQLTGYFHSAFHLARDTWTGLQFSCLDSPLVDPSYAKDIAAEYGEDSDMYRVRVLGEFPKSGIYNLISLDLVDAAMSRTLPANWQSHAPKVLGVDPAYEGTDRSAIILRQGLMARVLFTGRGLDTSMLAERANTFFHQESADTVFVDKTGVGAGVYDQLKRLGAPAIGIAFSAAPNEAERFVNKRVEMWWKVREWLEDGAILEKNTDLRADLIAPEYFITDRSKIQLESKESMRKRGMASPDLGDALALTFALPVRPKGFKAVTKNTFSDTFDPFS